MNNVTMIGNLTKDPQINWAKNGEAIAHFDIAVNRIKDGGDYFRVTVFGKQAENCERYLAKGRKVGIVGRLQNNSYKNKDGIEVKYDEIIATNVEFLTPKEKDVRNYEEDARNALMFGSVDDDLPY